MKADKLIEEMLTGSIQEDAAGLEGLLLATEKLIQNSLKAIRLYQQDPKRYAPQLKNITSDLNELRSISRRGLGMLSSL